MERSLADPFSDLSLDEVVRIYERWFRNAPRGFALLVYQGEAARREFLGRLGGKIDTLHFVDLSRRKDAQSVVESMASSLETWDTVVFFGFDDALPATPESARLFNYNRERLAGFGARQLWVLSPTWRRALLSGAFDLYSWFLPNNSIRFAEPIPGVENGRQSDTEEMLAAGPAPSQAARRSATSLLDRFERTFREQGEVSWDLLVGGLQALQSSGAYPWTYDLLERAQELIKEIRNSESNQSQEALRDLSVSLNNVGDVQTFLGQKHEALTSYEESLGIRRRLLDAYGESPEALRDLSVSLNMVGNVRRDLGRRDEALASYEESLGIARRLLNAYGESPEALRDLSVSLNNVGNARRDLGRRDEALTSYEESLGIARRLLDAYGESPQALRDLALSNGRVAQSRDFGSSERQQALAEADRIIERAIELYGNLPDLLEVQVWLQSLRNGRNPVNTSES